MSYSRKRTFNPTWNQKQQESKQAQKVFLQKVMTGKSLEEQKDKSEGEHEGEPEEKQGV